MEYEQRMSVFTEDEIAYLDGQKLGRLATVTAAGEPHVVPVGYRYHPETETIEIGGYLFAGSKKLRDVRANPIAAFVVDDLEGAWKVRGLEIRGRVEVVASGGKAIKDDWDEEFIRIRPQRIVSWGLEGDPYHPKSRAVEGR